MKMTNRTAGSAIIDDVVWAYAPIAYSNAGLIGRLGRYQAKNIADDTNWHKLDNIGPTTFTWEAGRLDALDATNSQFKVRHEGYYDVHGAGVWEANAAGRRGLRIAVVRAGPYGYTASGTYYIRTRFDWVQSANLFYQNVVCPDMFFAVDDVVTLEAWQNSGGTIQVGPAGTDDYDTFLSMKWIGSYNAS